jgi:hypothetical protein
VLAEGDRKKLLRVADQLSLELGYAGGDHVPGEDSGLGGEESAKTGILNSEDELLVAELRRRLAKVATAALDGAQAEGAGESAVGAALDGAEMVMRGELMMGNAHQLPALLPSFIFLVTLPLVDQDRALEISKRCATLVEGALG